MGRNIERNFLKIAGGWQIFHGLVSVIYFGIINRVSVIAEVYVNYGNQINPAAILSLVYLYGLLIVIIGIINLIVSKNYMKDTTINNSGYWLIFVVIISILSSDFISFILTLSATILYFAKNKAIKDLNYK